MNDPHDTNYPSIHFISRLSRGIWGLASYVTPGRPLAAVNAFFKLIRPSRVAVISLLTWVSAFVAGVPARGRWLVTLAGMFLSMAGFAVDIYTDRHADKQSPRPWPVNPISAGMMAATTARVWIIFFLLAAVSFCIAVHPLTLVPAAGLLLIYRGLAVGWLDGPIGRSVTLGLLQAMYVLLAAAATGTITVKMTLVATVFLSAMIGARAVGDIRDFPSDKDTDTRSLPKAYGIRATSWLLPAAITVSTAISFGLYAMGLFDRDYLFWTSVSFGPGFVLAWTLPIRPTPNYAFIIVIPYWGIGILYMLALYLGSR